MFSLPDILPGFLPRDRSGRFISRTPTLSPPSNSARRASARALQSIHPSAPGPSVSLPSSTPDLSTSSEPSLPIHDMVDHSDPPVSDLPSSQPLPATAPAPIMLTADALHALFSQFARAIPAGSPPAPVEPTPPSVSQSSLPPFHSIAASVVTPGESLYDLFPLIEMGTILDITKHVFKPLDLFRLDPASHDKNMELKTTLDFENGSLSAKARTGSLRDYPHLSYLIEPLSTYFNVLSTYAASSGNIAATYAISAGGFQYISHLSSLNRAQSFSTTRLFFCSAVVRC